MTGLALSLDLEESYFADQATTADPTILFRIFNYPPPPTAGPGLGRGRAHRLRADHPARSGRRRRPAGEVALEGWIDAPPVPGTFVCNIGDMLDRMTGGWYRSTPHRVRNLSGHGRLSFPFFFDPNFSAEVPPLPSRAAGGDDGRRRWDGQDLRAFSGTYGDYLLGKVGQVFPELGRDALE